MQSDFYNTKIIISGNKLEIYKINNYVVKSRGKIDDSIENEIIECDESIKSTKDKNTQSKKDRERALRDSRNSIIRLISSNPDMTTFITLTFAQESNYKESKKMLNNMFTKLRRDYEELKYLWVLEYGDINQRLHYHLLCNIPVSITLSSSKEYKSEEHKSLENYFHNKYWEHGWVDIRELNQEGNTNIAIYLSSYIVKSLSNINLDGYRVYGYSRKTLNRPREIKYYTKDSLEDILLLYKNQYTITYSSSYSIGYEDYKGNHRGEVSYIDLIRSVNDENK